MSFREKARISLKNLELKDNLKILTNIVCSVSNLHKGNFLKYYFSALQKSNRGGPPAILKQQLSLEEYSKSNAHNCSTL